MPAGSAGRSRRIEASRRRSEDAVIAALPSGGLRRTITHVRPLP